MSNIEVAGLNYYPIKSCGAVAAEEVSFSEFGIEHDREWMLVGSKGQFLSQRTHPKLALVQTRIEDNHLKAVAPDMGELIISLEEDPEAEIVAVDLWKKPGSGTLVSPEANSYFTDYLGKDARLLRIKQSRDIKPECRVEGASERTAFADGFPILLASTSSLDALNAHLDQPITVDRFRPNIVIEGAQAYDEDYWREVRIGNLRAFVVRACDRCPMPNIDQQIGELPKERPVTEALRVTRQGIDKLNGETGEFFGQNMTHVFEPGLTIKVGDTVSVMERAEERNIDMSVIT